jgi:ribosomal protein S18 acetylase RimI-like enzyme
LYSGKKEEGDRKYVDLLKDIQKKFVETLNSKIENQNSNLNENHINVNQPFIYEKRGNLTQTPGMNIKYVNPNQEEIGFCNLLDFDHSYFYDYDIERFYDGKDEYCVDNCEDNFFNGDNSLYLHDLKVHEPFKGNGYSKKLMNKSHEIAKKNGYKYVTLITNSDNVVAQNLYKKLGYLLHQTDGQKDFYYIML